MNGLILVVVALAGSTAAAPVPETGKISFHAGRQRVLIERIRDPVNAETLGVILFNDESMGSGSPSSARGPR